MGAWQPGRPADDVGDDGDCGVPGVIRGSDKETKKNVSGQT